MCSVYKMNLVLMWSPFEAATCTCRREVDISKAIQEGIIYNKLDYIDLKLITTKNIVSSNFELTKKPMEFFTTCRFTKVGLFVNLMTVILRHCCCISKIVKESPQSM